jgi:hypothetical protein
MKNSNLSKAKKEKNDEFYTLLPDIEKELMHYTKHFKNKIVYCNCDSIHSNFLKYFKINFIKLGLRKLIATSYNVYVRCEKIIIQYNSQGIEEIEITPLIGNGDFRSPECIEILKEADIVVTNPPFSLFREYVAQLIQFEKKFLLIGNINAVTYKEIFPLLNDKKMWLGNTSPKNFIQPDKNFKLFGFGADFMLWV